MRDRFLAKLWLVRREIGFFWLALYTFSLLEKSKYNAFELFVLCGIISIVVVSIIIIFFDQKK